MISYDKKNVTGNINTVGFFQNLKSIKHFNDCLREYMQLLMMLLDYTTCVHFSPFIVVKTLDKLSKKASYIQ